jgi:MFS family permease
MRPAPPPSGFAVIRRNPRFLALWLARTVSSSGDSVAGIALLLYAAETTGSPFIVALLSLAEVTLPSLLSPFAGAISDRVDRRAVMIACELGRGAAISIIALVHPDVVLLLTLVAVQGVVGQFFAPASQAAVPALVGDHELQGANAALGLGTNGLEVLGPGLAAILLTVLGLSGVLLADGITFLASALLLLRLPRLQPPSPTEEDGGTSYLDETRIGLTAIWRRPVVRIIIIGFFLVVAFTGVDDIALVFLARELGASESLTSLLYAGAGVGLLVGLVVLTRWSSFPPPLVMVAVGFLLSSGGNLMTGLAWAIPVAFATQVVRGIGISMQDVGARTQIQRQVPGELHGRVFSNLFGGIGLFAGLSYLLAGPAVQDFGPRAVFIGAGAGGVISGIAVGVALLVARTGSERDIDV